MQEREIKLKAGYNYIYYTEFTEPISKEQFKIELFCSELESLSGATYKNMKHVITEAEYSREFVRELPLGYQLQRLKLKFDTTRLPETVLEWLLEPYYYIDTAKIYTTNILILKHYSSGWNTIFIGGQKLNSQNYDIENNTIEVEFYDIFRIATEQCTDFDLSLKEYKTDNVSDVIYYIDGKDGRMTPFNVFFEGDISLVKVSDFRVALQTVIESVLSYLLRGYGTYYADLYLFPKIDFYFQTYNMKLERGLSVSETSIYLIWRYTARSGTVRFPEQLAEKYKNYWDFLIDVWNTSKVYYLSLIHI